MEKVQISEEKSIALREYALCFANNHHTSDVNLKGKWAKESLSQ